MKKVKSILIALSSLSFLCGGLVLGLNSNKTVEEVRADAIDVSGFTKITSDNLSTFTTYDKAYLIQGNAMNALNETAKTEDIGSATVYRLEYLDTVNNKVMFHSVKTGLYINQKSSSGYIATIFAPSQFDIDSNGRLSYVTSEDKTFYIGLPGGMPYLGPENLFNSSTYFYLYAMSKIDSLIYSLSSDVSYDPDGVYAPSYAAFNGVKTLYDSLASEEKLYLKDFEVTEGNKNTAEGKAISKYDYILSKYGAGEDPENSYLNFLGRTITPLGRTAASLSNNVEENNYTLFIVIALSSLSFIALTSFIILKKKRD